MRNTKTGRRGWCTRITRPCTRTLPTTLAISPSDCGSDHEHEAVLVLWGALGWATSRDHGLGSDPGARGSESRVGPQGDRPGRVHLVCVRPAPRARTQDTEVVPTVKTDGVVRKTGGKQPPHP